MSTEIRIERNRFQPGQELASQVAVLEQRVVLNSSFKFPAGFVGGAMKGNLMMTSRAYEVAQRTVDKAFADFAGTMAKIAKNTTLTPLQVTTLIGGNGGGVGPYAANSALGRLDKQMEIAEALFPYGRGFTIDPVVGTQLGVGLSVRSFNGFSGAGPSPNLVIPANSVAGALDAFLLGSTVGAKGFISTVRFDTLAIGGTMKNYLSGYGPLAPAPPGPSFSLKNS
ncbi:MAG: hypothetical protein WCJ40_12975 [Planctomycetota bacterium]